MKEYIAFDSHKHYTLVERENRTCRGCNPALRPGVKILLSALRSRLRSVRMCGPWRRL